MAFYGDKEENIDAYDTDESRHKVLGCLITLAVIGVIVGLSFCG